MTNAVYKEATALIDTVLGTVKAEAESSKSPEERIGSLTSIISGKVKEWGEKDPPGKFKPDSFRLLACAAAGIAICEYGHQNLIGALKINEVSTEHDFTGRSLEGLVVDLWSKTLACRRMLEDLCADGNPVGEPESARMEILCHLVLEVLHSLSNPVCRKLTGENFDGCRDWALNLFCAGDERAFNGCVAARLNELDC